MSLNGYHFIVKFIKFVVFYVKIIIDCEDSGIHNFNPHGACMEAWNLTWYKTYGANLNVFDKLYKMLHVSVYMH